MTHNIIGFKEHLEYIETKSFYKKYNGQITVKNKGIIIAETEKAILFREEVNPNMYSTVPMWIAKSKITKREVLN